MTTGPQPPLTAASPSLGPQLSIERRKCGPMSSRTSTSACGSGGAALAGVDGPFNGFGLALDHHEQHPRGAFGPLALLFPVAQRSRRDPEAGREFRLREPEFASDAAHINVGRHVHTI